QALGSQGAAGGGIAPASENDDDTVPVNTPPPVSSAPDGAPAADTTPGATPGSGIPPGIGESSTGSTTPPTVPPGDVASGETQNAVYQVAEQLVACANAGDTMRVLAT